MLRQVDRETVEALSQQFLKIILDFQRHQSGMNMELLNAIAVGAAIVLASAPAGERGEKMRNWFLLALDNQIADFRREFGGG